MNFLSIPGWIIRFMIIGGLFAVAAVADDDSAASSDGHSESNPDAEPDDYFQLENCISASRIRSTSIIDDRTIIFYMNQRKIYVNHLPHRCAGLKIAGTFSYRLRGSQLCNVDTITVTRMMGGGINTGPSCGLGHFRPVTEEEVAMLKNKEVEVPPQEPASTDESGQGKSERSETEPGEAD